MFVDTGLRLSESEFFGDCKLTMAIKSRPSLQNTHFIVPKETRENPIQIPSKIKKQMHIEASSGPSSKETFGNHETSELFILFPSSNRTRQSK